MKNCSDSLNRLDREDKWTNCKGYRLGLESKDLTWKSFKHFIVNKRVSNSLKIDLGMNMTSTISGRKFTIKERLGRKEYVIEPSIKK